MSAIHLFHVRGNIDWHTRAATALLDGLQLGNIEYHRCFAAAQLSACHGRRPQSIERSLGRVADKPDSCSFGQKLVGLAAGLKLNANLMVGFLKDGGTAKTRLARRQFNFYFINSASFKHYPHPPPTIIS